MVGVSGIPLDYVMLFNMPDGWTESKKHDCLKYNVIHIGLAWEADKMVVYNNLNDCCLDGKGWLCIKDFDAQKYLRQATANLHENYEGSGKVNKRVVWSMDNIDNAHFTIKHTFSFEKLLTVL